MRLSRPSSSHANLIRANISIADFFRRSMPRYVQNAVHRSLRPPVERAAGNPLEGGRAGSPPCLPARRPSRQTLEHPSSSDAEISKALGLQEEEESQHPLAETRLTAAPGRAPENGCCDDHDWPIASGNVEGGHRTFIHPVTKRGTGWLVENLNAVVALACVRKNEWWDEFWTFVASRRQERRVAAEAAKKAA